MKRLGVLSPLFLGVIVIYALTAPASSNPVRHTSITSTSASSRLDIEPSFTLPYFKLPYNWDANIYWTGGPHAYSKGGEFEGTYDAGSGSGLDFSNGTNFDVLAMAAGTVIDASCNDARPLGCQVAIRHDEGGTVMVYGHLKHGSLQVHENNWVPQGRLLAEAGATGTGAHEATHLHIDLRNGSDSCGPPADCLPNNLGGGPIGWDDGIPLVDGYRIHGYLRDLDDPFQSYNYDGSAVRGNGSGHIWPFEEWSSGIRKLAVIWVDETFVCNENAETCENNKQTNMTQFAGNGAPFGRVGINGTPATQSDGDTAGVLVSTNRRAAFTSYIPLLRGHPETAPGQVWSIAYGGISRDAFTDILPLENGEFTAVGSTRSFLAQSDDAWIVKMRASGSIIWQKHYGGPMSEWMSYVAPGPAGSVFVAQTSSSFSPTSSGTGILVQRLDAEGNPVWQKAYGLSDHPTLYSPSALEATDDGGVLLASTAYIPGYENSKGWVLKLDLNGQIQWQQTYDPGPRNDMLTGIVQVQNGGYLAAGWSWSFFGGIWLMKLDHSGNVLWVRKYGSEYITLPGFVGESPQDDFYVVSNLTLPPYSNTDTLVLKVGSNGEKIWGYVYDISPREYSTSAAVTPDGEIIIVGYTTILTNTDGWVLGLDNNGGIAWQVNLTGLGNDRPNAVELVPDDTIIVVGETSSVGSGDLDGWAIKFKPQSGIPSCNSINSIQSFVQKSTTLLGGSNTVQAANTGTDVVPTNMVLHNTSGATFAICR